jgi:hypothetical protein
MVSGVKCTGRAKKIKNQLGKDENKKEKDRKRSWAGMLLDPKGLTFQATHRIARRKWLDNSLCDA